MKVKLTIEINEKKFNYDVSCQHCFDIPEMSKERVLLLASKSFISFAEETLRTSKIPNDMVEYYLEKRPCLNNGKFTDKKSE